MGFLDGRGVVVGLLWIARGRFVVGSLFVHCKVVVSSWIADGLLIVFPWVPHRFVVDPHGLPIDCSRWARVLVRFLAYFP